MSRALEAPIPNKRKADAFVNVSHWVYQSIDCFILGYIDHTFSFFKLAVISHSFHSELFEQVYHISDLRYCHVSLFVNNECRQDEIFVLFETPAIKSLRKIIVRFWAHIHVFVTVVQDFDQPCTRYFNLPHGRGIRRRTNSLVMFIEVHDFFLKFGIKWVHIKPCNDY